MEPAASGGRSQQHRVGGARSTGVGGARSMGGARSTGVGAARSMGGASSVGWAKPGARPGGSSSGLVYPTVTRLPCPEPTSLASHCFTKHTHRFREEKATRLNESQKLQLWCQPGFPGLKVQGPFALLVLYLLTLKLPAFNSTFFVCFDYPKVCFL